MDTKLMRFRDYFANRSILLTGGTGFIGMGLIEGLLSSSPDLRKIYVVVRAKKGQSPSERVVKLLTSEIFNHLSAETKAKVVPIVGNLTSQDLGLDPITLKEIRETVTIVYHNAGLIKFNRSLKEAVLMNVLSTLRCIDLAKSLVHLSAFIYSSTAWANSNIQDKIQEVIYKTKESPREMIRLALETPSTIDRVAEAQDDFIEGHQNTYSYSKQLAENLILEEMAGLPTGIVRPSLVYGFYQHEIPGWMGSSQSGHCGVIRLFIKGAGRNLFGNPKSTVFAVPCDHVVNCMLALTVSVGSRTVPSNKPEICHVSNNNDINPITIQDMATILNEESWKNPCDSYFLLPRLKVRNGLRSDLYYLGTFIVTLIMYIPERIFAISPPWMRGFHIINLQYKGKKYFTEISNCDNDFHIENLIKLSNNLHPEDTKRFSFNPNDVDFRVLFANSISWLRKYYYKDSGSVTWMHRVVQRGYLMVEFFSYSSVFVLATVGAFLITQSLVISTIVGLLVVWFIVWI